MSGNSDRPCERSHPRVGSKLVQGAAAEPSEELLRRLVAGVGGAGVWRHLAALQRIADENGGGTPPNRRSRSIASRTTRRSSMRGSRRAVSWRATGGGRPGSRPAAGVGGPVNGSIRSTTRAGTGSIISTASPWTVSPARWPAPWLGSQCRRKPGYPADSRAGDNCLIATKAMVPVDGPVRTGVGLLGSPSFPIPRSVQRDGRFDHLARPDVLRRRLAAKTRHNTVTIALQLFVLWLLSFIWIAAALAAVDLYHLLGTPALPVRYWSSWY